MFVKGRNKRKRVGGKESLNVEAKPDLLVVYEENWPWKNIHVGITVLEMGPVAQDSDNKVEC